MTTAGNAQCARQSMDCGVGVLLCSTQCALELSGRTLCVAAEAGAAAKASISANSSMQIVRKLIPTSRMGFISIELYLIVSGVQQLGVALDH